MTGERLNFFFHGGREEPRTRALTFPWQRHPWVLIEIPQGGEWSVALKRGHLQVRDGEVLLLKPGVRHQMRMASEGRMTTAFALLSWRRWSGDDVVAQCRFPQVLPRTTGTRVLPLLQGLIENARDAGLAAVARQQQLGFALLEAISVHAAAPLSPQSSGEDPRLARVLDHIDANWNTALNRADLARIAGLSPSRFHAIFREATGFAPLEYMLAIRLQRASEMLESTTQTISEIAAACGFSSVYYFSRCFATHKQVPPTTYRAQFRR